MTIGVLRHKGATVALIIALLFLATVAVAAQYVYAKHLWATDTLEQIDSRYARLLGLRDSDARLSQSVADAQAALGRLAYPAARDAAQVGNELQQVLRRGMQSAGLTVVNSQVMPARPQARLERIAVSVQGEGSLAALQLYLSALQGESPMISTENIAVQATGRVAADGSPVVSVNQTAFVMRVGS